MPTRPSPRPTLTNTSIDPTSRGVRWGCSLDTPGKKSDLMPHSGSPLRKLPLQTFDGFTINGQGEVPPDEFTGLIFVINEVGDGNVVSGYSVEIHLHTVSHHQHCITLLIVFCNTKPECVPIQGREVAGKFVLWGHVHPVPCGHSVGVVATFTRVAGKWLNGNSALSSSVSPMCVVNQL